MIEQLKTIRAAAEFLDYMPAQKQSVLAALAQLEAMVGEPVLFIHPSTFAMDSGQVGAWKPGHELKGYIPLYRAAPVAKQPQPNRAQKMRDAGYTRRPRLREFPRDGDDEQPQAEAVPLLSDEEINDIANRLEQQGNTLRQFARAIEARLIGSFASWQEPLGNCTNGDAWNCKYCRKTETCEALKDPRNFAAPVAQQHVPEADCGNITPAELAKRIERGEKWEVAQQPQAEAVPQRETFEVEFAKLGYQWSDSNKDKAFLGWSLAMERTPQQAEAVPTIYVSRGQLENLKPDPEDAAGTYLPVRKTPKGKFTHPLFTAPRQAEAVPSATFDGVIPAAIRSYLRRCSSGGMSKKHIDIVQANVDEAERLGYFKLAIAEAVLAARAAQGAKT